MDETNLAAYNCGTPIIENVRTCTMVVNYMSLHFAVALRRS
jgi:hypothetical protein